LNLDRYAGNVDKARKILAKAKSEAKHEWKVFLESVLLEMRANSICSSHSCLVVFGCVVWLCCLVVLFGCVVWLCCLVVLFGCVVWLLTTQT
jgi:hypothetical protein